MERKVPKKMLFASIIIIIAVFSASFAIAKHTGKTGAAKNEKVSEKNVSREISQNISGDGEFGGKYFGYYTENEIRDELRKAGVKSVSIEAFIAVNNGIRDKTVSYEQIEEELLKALKLDEKNYLVLDALGQVYYRATEEDKETVKEISYYEKAIKSNPKFRKGYEHLVWASRGYDDKKPEIAERARKYSEQLIKLFPESPVGYFVLSEYYEYYKKDYDKSLPLGDKAKELSYKEEPKRYFYEVAVADDEYERMLADDELSNNSNEKTEGFGEYFYSNKRLGDILLYSQLETYLKKGDDKETFSYFYNSYGKMKEYGEFLKKGKLHDDLIEGYIVKIKKLNEKYKNTDKKLYENNLKKFKELGL